MIIYDICIHLCKNHPTHGVQFIGGSASSTNLAQQSSLASDVHLQAFQVRGKAKLIQAVLQQRYSQLLYSLCEEKLVSEVIQLNFRR